MNIINRSKVKLSFCLITELYGKSKRTSTIKVEHSPKGCPVFTFLDRSICLFIQPLMDILATSVYTQGRWCKVKCMEWWKESIAPSSYSNVMSKDNFGTKKIQPAYSSLSCSVVMNTSSCCWGKLRWDAVRTLDLDVQRIHI